MATSAANTGRSLKPNKIMHSKISPNEGIARPILNRLIIRKAPFRQ
jgi:hypothetical protein